MRLARAALVTLIAFAAGIPGCNSGGVGDDSGPNADRSELRIVALAPHLAELVFAVGAGDTLVGTSSYTDFPGYTKPLPVVGDAFAIDQERLALLDPDLLLAWKSGTPAHVVDELRLRGFRVEVIETRTLDDVPVALEQIGRLTGQSATAAEAAQSFRAQLRALSGRYGSSPPIRVFYQVSNRPLYTISGEHYVSELIELCGGENVFAELNVLAPLVDVEAVLARDPEVLLASSDSDDAFAVWRRWPELAANRYDNLFLLPADSIGRATPRLAEAGETLCGVLDEARRKRASGST